MGGLLDEGEGEIVILQDDIEVGSDGLEEFSHSSISNLNDLNRVKIK